MKFSEIPSHFTGFSTPLFGVSFQPTEADVSVARRLLRLLEDRRVLYAPFWSEEEESVTQSVLQIRELLNRELANRADPDDDVSTHMRAMRAACRKFLDDEQASREYVMSVPGPGEPPENYQPPRFEGSHIAEFYSALGAFRATMGFHIGQVAAKYGLDIEDDLASTLPPPDQEG